MQEVSEPLELLYNADEVKKFAEEDMDFFGALVCPEDLDLEFPPFYVSLWQLVVTSLKATRDFSKFAIGLPRGHGKTMVVKLLCIFAILFTKKRYILVIGANLKKARSIVADICDMLDSPNVQEVFGNWRYAIETDSQDLKKFSFQGRSLILEAAGQGTSIRGSQQKNARPDMIIFDDAQTQECAASIVESNSFRTWFLGTALKAKSPKGCTYLYIGNMYKDIESVPGTGIYNCMLRNLKNSPDWTSFVVGAILQDGTALWEELISYHELITEYKQDLNLGQPEIFYAEVLNDPKAMNSMYVDLKKIVRREKQEYDIPQGNYIVIDPATSKQTADQLVVGYFELYDGTPVFEDYKATKMSGPQTVHFTIDWALKLQCSLIVVEDTAYQYSLCEWFTFVLEQRGITGIKVRPLSNSGRSKNGRILDLFKDLQSGEVLTTPNTHAAIINQAASFDPLKKDNLDDILDTCEMGKRVPMLFPHEIAIPGLPMLNLGPDQTVSPPLCNF